MQKKHKNLTACAVAAIFGLSCMVCPVQAKEAEFDGQTDMAGLLEVDETAVPLEEKAEPDTAPAPETGEPEPVTQEQTEREADKEEPTSEPAETEQETQLEATEQTNGEAEPQEQTAPVNALSSARASTISIGNADALIDFATKINNGTYPQDTNAILTDNIDMSGDAE